MRVMDPNILDSLYGWLCECATTGAPCPGNQTICDRYGFKSMATASGAIKKLETQGKITVRRYNQARQVYIPATGQRTAAPKMEKKQGHVPVLPALRKRVVAPKTSKKASPPRKPRKPRATAVGPRSRQCQWIEGLPTRDDSCKCLAETPPGEPYCPSHEHRSRRHTEYIPRGYMKPSLKGLGG